jgi:hypothetical protein
MLGRQVSINLRGFYVLVPEQLLERIEVNAGHGLYVRRRYASDHAAGTSAPPWWPFHGRRASRTDLPSVVVPSFKLG